MACVVVTINFEPCAHKSRVRGWERVAEMRGGFTQQPGRPSLKKQKQKTYLFLWNKKILTVK